MIKLLIALALLVQATYAHALAPNYPAVLKRIMFNASGGSYTWYADPVEACHMKYNLWPIVQPSTVKDHKLTINGPTNLKSSYLCTTIFSNGSPDSAAVPSHIEFNCPYGGSYQASGTYANMCTNVPDGGGPPPMCPKGVKSTVRHYGQPSSSTYKTPNAYRGCEVGVVEVIDCFSAMEGTTKVYFCDMVVENTGNPAAAGSTAATSPSDAPPVNDPDRQPVPPFTGQPGSGCPKGTVQGGINSDGVPMCIGTGTAPPVPPPLPPTKTTESTTANPDGSTTTTTTNVQTNRDGSTSTTTVVVTKAPDGSTSTSGGTVVSQTPSGAAGSTDSTPEQDQANFCKQNPQLAVCRDSSVSGTCGEIACMGDAIQCATLRAAAAMECKQREDAQLLKDSPLNALGSAASSGNDPMGDSLPSAANATIVNMPSMSGDHGWIGGGSAFKDVSFTVQGKTFTVPLNKWSSYLEGLRYALMVLATLVSFRMVSGTILRD